MPVPDAIETQDWMRWAPEIMAGYESASADMAASYARRAAIEFAQSSRVLQRVLAIELQEGVLRYPLEPFEQERVQGFMRVDTSKGCAPVEACPCGQERTINLGAIRLNKATQELVFDRDPTKAGVTHMLVTVWVSPTEDACEHDAFLYEQYRTQITKGARGLYISEVLSIGQYKSSRGYGSYRGDASAAARGDALVREFRLDALRARNEAEMQGRRAETSRGGYVL